MLVIKQIQKKLNELTELSGIEWYIERYKNGEIIF